MSNTGLLGGMLDWLKEIGAIQAKSSGAIVDVELPEENRTSIEIYRDKRNKHRWRYKAGNGEILAISSEGYDSRQSLDHALNIIRRDFPNAKTNC
jgi:uncharacterized protein YegP (UPF0339 family)